LAPASALRLALLAVFGVVREVFIVKKQLLAGREHKLGATIVTLQYPVDKFHGRLPCHRGIRRIGHESESLPVPFPCALTRVNNKGPGR
jgi:hypothetical protein